MSPSLEQTAEKLQRLGQAEREVHALRKKDLRTVEGGAERTAAMQERTRQERQIRAEAEGLAGDLLHKEAG